MVIFLGLYRIAHLSRETAEQCRRLCNTNSEMQEEFTACRSSRHVIVVRVGDVVAWAAAGEYLGMQSFQVFVAGQMRRRGFAMAAVASLRASGLLRTGKPVAVFAKECVSIALRLSMIPYLYVRGDDGEFQRVHDDQGQPQSAE